MRTCSAQSGLRLIALAAAFICLWMSTGAMLHHTDDLSEFLTFQAAQGDTLRHAGQAASFDTCAAHEWMDAWKTLYATRPFVRWTPVVLATVSINPTIALHLRPFDYTALRGPPSLFS